MTPIQSENGIVCTTPAWGSNGDVTLVVPKHLLTQLQAAWQQTGGDEGYTDIVTAVRDLFDGQDGALQFLAQIGIETVPT